MTPPSHSKMVNTKMQSPKPRSDDGFPVKDHDVVCIYGYLTHISPCLSFFVGTYSETRTSWFCDLGVLCGHLKFSDW